MATSAADSPPAPPADPPAAPPADPPPAPPADPPPAPPADPLPDPLPGPPADPGPDADPQPDHDSQRDPAPAPDEPDPHPAAAGAVTAGPQASAYGTPPGNDATADLATAAVVDTAVDPTAGMAARGASIVARVVSRQADRPAEKPIALGAEPDQPVPDLLTTLRAQTEQRETPARGRATGAPARKPSAARRDSPPDPSIPSGPPQDVVVGSAAGPGGIAPPALWFLICTGHAVRAGHELRRLRAPLLAPDLPGLPSLRDRPG